jgi:hypothetical protein
MPELLCYFGSGLGCVAPLSSKFSADIWSLFLRSGCWNWAAMMMNYPRFRGFAFEDKDNKVKFLQLSNAPSMSS